MLQFNVFLLWRAVSLTQLLVALYCLILHKACWGKRQKKHHNIVLLPAAQITNSFCFEEWYQITLFREAQVSVFVVLIASTHNRCRENRIGLIDLLFKAFLNSVISMIFQWFSGSSSQIEMMRVSKWWQEVSFLGKLSL